MDFVTLVTALYEGSGIDVPERDDPLVATVDGFVARLTAGPRTRTGPCHSGMLLPTAHESSHAPGKRRARAERADDVPASDGG